MATQTTVFSFRLDPKLKKRLDKLAKTTRRSRAYLAADAIQQYIELNEWQVAEIKKGIEEADRGEFASKEKVERILRKWNSLEYVR